MAGPTLRLATPVSAPSASAITTPFMVNFSPCEHAFDLMWQILDLIQNSVRTA